MVTIGHRLSVIVNMGHKIYRMKISIMRAGGEKGEDFLQAKISSCNIMVFSAHMTACTVFLLKIWHENNIA